MTVERTTDLDYVRAVLRWPGMLRAPVTGTVGDTEAMLRRTDLTFYAVREGVSALGFILFRAVVPLVAEIHVALTTIGRRTEQAIRSAMADMKAQGARLFVALIPKGHRPLLRLADTFGFRDAPDMASLYPAWCAGAFIFKDRLA